MNKGTADEFLKEICRCQLMRSLTKHGTEACVDIALKTISDNKEFKEKYGHLTRHELKAALERFLDCVLSGSL